MIEAIIFDCFGVLTKEGWVDFKNKSVGDDVVKAAHINNAMKRVASGELSDVEFIRDTARVTNVTEDQLRNILHDNAPNYELLDFIKSLKGKYKIGILSNAGTNPLPRLFSQDQLALFDSCVISSEIGYTKPQPQAYYAAAESLGISPDKCVFVDDIQKYCEAAEAVGMKAIKFINTADFILKIKALQ